MELTDRKVTASRNSPSRLTQLDFVVVETIFEDLIIAALDFRLVDWRRQGCEWDVTREEQQLPSSQQSTAFLVRSDVRVLDTSNIIRWMLITSVLASSAEPGRAAERDQCPADGKVSRLRHV